jgi:hypothetical protein
MDEQKSRAVLSVLRLDHYSGSLAFALTLRMYPSASSLLKPSLEKHLAEEGRWSKWIVRLPKQFGKPYVAVGIIPLPDPVSFLLGL